MQQDNHIIAQSKNKMGAGSGEIYRQFSSVLGAEGKGAGDAKNKESKDNKESKSVVVEK